MKKNKNKDIIAVYRPTAASQIMGIMMVLNALFMILFMTLQGFKSITEPDTPSGLFYLVFICMCVIYGIRYWFLLTRDRLIVRTDGIIWIIRGIESCTDWNSFEKTGKYRGFFRSKATRWGIFADGRRFIPIDYYIPLPSFQVFSAEQDKLQQFRDTEIGETIYIHAPHLFDDLKQKKGKYNV